MLRRATYLRDVLWKEYEGKKDDDEGEVDDGDGLANDAPKDDDGGQWLLMFKGRHKKRMTKEIKDFKKKQDRFCRKW